MIFPELKNKRFGYVNLNLEAEKWVKEQNFEGDESNTVNKETNPLLDPVICEKMVSDIHKKLHLDFSYGGWLEDRSILWKGSYLEEWKTFIHLGIDVNVPVGTLIACDFDAEVIKIDDDYPEVGGWGPRIILKHALQPIYMIYAHLDKEIFCKVGDKLKKGDIIAKVGYAPFNGNWFPHLHLQVISQEYFDELEENNLWNELDGYGTSEDREMNSLRFLDPMQYILFSPTY